MAKYQAITRLPVPVKKDGKVVDWITTMLHLDTYKAKSLKKASKMAHQRTLIELDKRYSAEISVAPAIKDNVGVEWVSRIGADGQPVTPEPTVSTSAKVTGTNVVPITSKTSTSKPRATTPAPVQQIYNLLNPITPEILAQVAEEIPNE